MRIERIDGVMSQLLTKKKEQGCTWTHSTLIPNAPLSALSKNVSINAWLARTMKTIAGSTNLAPDRFKNYSKINSKWSTQSKTSTQLGSMRYTSRPWTHMRWSSQLRLLLKSGLCQESPSSQSSQQTIGSFARETKEMQQLHLTLQSSNKRETETISTTFGIGISEILTSEILTKTKTSEAFSLTTAILTRVSTKHNADLESVILH